MPSGQVKCNSFSNVAAAIAVSAAGPKRRGPKSREAGEQAKVDLGQEAYDQGMTFMAGPEAADRWVMSAAALLHEGCAQGRWVAVRRIEPSHAVLDRNLVHLGVCGVCTEPSHAVLNRNMVHLGVCGIWVLWVSWPLRAYVACMYNACYS